MSGKFGEKHYNLTLNALREYLDRGRPALVRMAEHGSTHATEDDGRALFLNHRGQRLTLAVRCFATSS